MKMTHIH